MAETDAPHPLPSISLASCVAGRIEAACSFIPPYPQPGSQPDVPIMPARRLLLRWGSASCRSEYVCRTSCGRLSALAFRTLPPSSIQARRRPLLPNSLPYTSGMRKWFPLRQTGSALSGSHRQGRAKRSEIRCIQPCPEQPPTRLSTRTLRYQASLCAHSQHPVPSSSLPFVARSAGYIHVGAFSF